LIMRLPRTFSHPNSPVTAGHQNAVVGYRGSKRSQMNKVAATLSKNVIGLLNATVVLVLKIITFPLTILTLGLFWFVINALMLELASAFVRGFQVRGFVPALIGAVVLSLVSSVLQWIFMPSRRAN